MLQTKYFVDKFSIMEAMTTVATSKHRISRINIFEGLYLSTESSKKCSRDLPSKIFSARTWWPSTFTILFQPLSLPQKSYQATRSLRVILGRRCSVWTDCNARMIHAVVFILIMLYTCVAFLVNNHCCAVVILLIRGMTWHPWRRLSIERFLEMSSYKTCILCLQRTWWIQLDMVK